MCIAKLFFAGEYGSVTVVQSPCLGGGCQRREYMLLWRKVLLHSEGLIRRARLRESKRQVQYLVIKADTFVSR